MIGKKIRDIIRVTIPLILVINYVCISELIPKMKIKSEMIYILIWTSPSEDSFLSMKLGQNSFIENQCEYQNCFLTDNFTVPLAVTHFGALLFYLAALRKDPFLPMPTERIIEQKYVFVSTEPSAHFPITAYYDNFFNWTWTYKLDSDIVIANIAIRNESGQVIGPKTDMNWIPIEVMKPLGYEVIRKLEKKTNAVAWFVENCTVISPHEGFVAALRNELAKYNHSVHILGQCRQNNEDIVSCYNKQECYDTIQSRYYFHLSFENVMSEDYVTDQLLIALTNYAVPVVFGGANYTRFMPDGIYLDAFELGPVELAIKMYSIISDDNTYYNMFKWHRYYSYHDPRQRPDSNSICAFCDMLNNFRKQKSITMYTNIVKWFNERKDWNVNPKPTVKYEVTRWVSKS